VVKRITVLSLFSMLSVTFNYAQQNLVHNYPFEQKLQCINWWYEFTGYVANWNGGGAGLSWLTSDSNCNSGGVAGVPNNYYGNQKAHSGISYCEFATYVDQASTYPYYYNDRGYIQEKLSSPLERGAKYCVDFFVSLGDTYFFACNNMGAYFSDSMLEYALYVIYVKSYLTPQVANDPINNPLTNVFGWTKIAGSFVASGGEKYINIGNFTDDSKSIITPLASNASPSMINAYCAYYYIDDVSVNQVFQSHVGRDTLICAGGKVLIGKDTAVPGVSYSWLPELGLSNSNAAQTYASPTVTTTYTLTVINDSMVKCGCPDSLTKDSVTINVINMPISVCCSTTITDGQSVTLTSSLSYKYLWVPETGLNNDTTQNVQAAPSVTTVYYITETDSNGCKAMDSVIITVIPEPCGEVFIPDAFSPNESYNPILYVRGDCITSMDFNVFDRWGNKVYESQNLNNGWDGTYKGLPLNMGTYIWLVKATLLDGTNFEKKGNVTLVR
jgi:gliding motility-associated-like protein